jgi:flagellar hook-associated protein 1 FlgK
MINSLYIGISGLMASQKAVNTVSNNISNGETKGYTKQKIIMESNSYNTIGNGVLVNTIIRNNDNFLSKDFNQKSSIYNFNDTLNQNNQKLNDILNEKTTTNTLTDLIEKYFNSVQKLNGDPTNINIKNEVEDLSKSLLNRKEELNNIFDNNLISIQKEIDINTNIANEYINKLDSLTKDINIQENTSNYVKNPVANELRDKRDIYEKKLNELGNFNVFKSNWTDNNDYTKEEYTYEFKDSNGKIGGLKESIKSIIEVKNLLNNKFDEIKPYLDQGGNVDSSQVLFYFYQNGFEIKINFIYSK